MTLDELLQECRSRHLILLINRRGLVSLWAPNTPVPRKVRAAIHEYREELVTRIIDSDTQACPAPSGHRPYWTYRNGSFICGACERLLSELDKVG